MDRSHVNDLDQLINWCSLTLRVVLLQRSIGAPGRGPVVPLPGAYSPLTREMTMANILIIDDQSCVRQLISEELVLEGHQVHSLGKAELVREHLQAFQPDLVLLDLFLDGFEGFAVCRDIKCQNPELPVVILTAYDGYQDDPRLWMADGYVVKSCNFTELKTVILNVLEGQPARRNDFAVPLCLCEFGVA